MVLLKRHLGLLSQVKVVASHHLLQKVKVSQNGAYLAVGVVDGAEDEVEHGDLFVVLADEIDLGKGVRDCEFLDDLFTLLDSEQVND